MHDADLDCFTLDAARVASKDKLMGDVRLNGRTQVRGTQGFRTRGFWTILQVSFALIRVTRHVLVLHVTKWTPTRRATQAV